MTQRFSSLSGQLSYAILVWVCGFWIASAAAVGWYVHTEIAEGFDSALTESAVRLLELAAHEHEHARSDADLDTASTGTPAPQMVYQLVDVSGRVLMKSSGAPEQTIGASLEGGFSQTNQWRIYSLGNASRTLFIHVADPVSHRAEARNESLLFLLSPLFGILPLLAYLVNRTVRLRLAPVDELRVQVRLRGGPNLDPVNVLGLPDELVSLADSVNQLLLRLHEALQTERSLAANAAHELRTPLTVAQLRLANALALDLSTAARAEVNFVSDALIKLKRRTEKLLQLSRAESGAALTKDTVVLNEVISAVLQDFDTVKTAIHFLHRASTPLLQVNGDFDSMAIALRNLIENSLRYGQGSVVEIEVGDTGEIVIRDFGPGVSAQMLGELSVRHVRQSKDATGFGLGLSIVKTILDRHGGQLRFVSPPEGHPTGFEVRLVF